MRKIILAVAVIMATAFSVLGQEKGIRQPKRSAEDRTEKIVAKMKVDLVLSDDQVLKLKPVILRREQQRSEMYAKMDTTKSNTKKVLKDSDEEIKRILTSEQYEKLKEQRKEARNKHRVMHEGIKQE